MAGEWEWPGARWWKCDLHVHTTGSDDHRDRPVPDAASWITAAKRAGLHVVAVTDHNTPCWIDRVRDPGLTVFPGVELTCASGIHVLVLFDPELAPDAARDRVAGFIGACAVTQTEPNKNHTWRSSKSLRDVMAIASEQRGLCIAAHADKANGFIKEEQRGEEIRRIVTDPNLAGVELDAFDPTVTRYLDGSMKTYRRGVGLLPLITSSDAHKVADIGRRWTWIKMTKPTLSGLRLALQDGPLSVQNDSCGTADPNTVPGLAVESVSIANTAHLGNGTPFELPLSPWLNALIGGRGTGKSTVVELLRVALQRGAEVPQSLKGEWDQLVRLRDKTTGRGVLKAETVVSVIYRRDGGRFRITWKTPGSPSEIEEDDGGTWVSRTGDVASRFPVRVYSQKQVYELTRSPEALLQIIDESHDVDAASWTEAWNVEEARFLSLRAQAREVAVALADEPRVLGALDDVKRRLAVFEGAGHAAVLKTWQARRRQERAVEEWETDIASVVTKMTQLSIEAEPGPFAAEPFDAADVADVALLTEAKQTATQMEALREEARDLARRAAGIRAAWVTKRAASEWSGQVRASVEAYERLIDVLKEAGGGDPSEYGRLVQQRGALEVRLAAFAGQRETNQALVSQATAALARLRSLRDEITTRRAEFLAKTLAGNEYVRIEVIPCGSPPDVVERDLRKLLGREDTTFASEFGTLASELVTTYPHDFEVAAVGDRTAHVEQFHTRLGDLKSKLREIARTTDGKDRTFRKHLQTRTPESLDRLECWYPQDSLLVSYRTGAGRSTTFQPITQGSPGQRSAAMLAFLLSHGNEPIVLDQPEDDLDNHLIYDLIVKQLRLIKLRRQVIVVTHNANIVVNGDAEYVVALKVGNGQNHTECAGGLQEQAVRNTICTVMEGGKDAFRDRYRRIAPGDTDV